MTGTVLLQSFVNGLMAGWIYILFAVGLSLVLSIAGIIQLAHGEVYMLGGYATFYFFTLFDLNFILALILSILVVGLIGVGLEKVFFKPIRNKFESALVITLALTISLQALAAVTFGSRTKAITSSDLFPGIVNFFGVTIALERLVVILISIVLTVALILFVSKTKIGQGMQAVSQDMTAAELQGINIDWISSVTMFMACGLAAAAGGLMGVLFNISPDMGGSALMKGIAVIIIGGLGSIPGAVIGGLLLGLIDGIVPTLLSSEVASIIGFVFMILILIIRPQGIMGHE